VRELQNVIERACALASGSQLEVGDIQLDSPRNRANTASDRLLPEGMTLDQWEDEMIREALKRAGAISRKLRGCLGSRGMRCVTACRRLGLMTTMGSEVDHRVIW